MGVTKFRFEISSTDIKCDCCPEIIDNFWLITYANGKERKICDECFDEMF